MGLRRACSYQATFRTPEAPANYSAILVTLQQYGQNLISKTEDDLIIGDTDVVLNLTQEETALFESPGVALMQIRCYESTYNAPGSAVFQVEVWPALDDQILTGNGA